jgi:hypothetical protein
MLLYAQLGLHSETLRLAATVHVCVSYEFQNQNAPVLLTGDLVCLFLSIEV